MMPFSIFTSVDWKDPFEVILVVCACIFGGISLFANRFSIPFLHRKGGLLTYSKFATSDVKFGATVSSKVGMTLFYFPSFLVGSVYFFSRGLPKNADSILQDPGTLGASLMVFHFGKRTSECLFLHKYSGNMPLATSFFITSIYLLTTFGVCVLSSKKDTFDKDSGSDVTRNVGIVVFTIGQMGNGYHHYLLSNLRRAPGEANAYKVPTGGLFEYVAAPHYLFEIIGWTGTNLVCQHMLLPLALLAMTLYLCDRSVGQSKWNRTNLKEKYPSHRKHMVPFLF